MIIMNRTVFGRKDESMISFRGDAHKIYLQLKNASNKGQSYKRMACLVEIEEINQFYQSIDSSTLKLIFYRMIKEKNGSGIVPVFVSSIPWFLFMFSNKIQEFLFQDGRFIWLIVFALLYFTILIFSVILHFRERAWAAAHIEIIQDILKKRKDIDIA
jgi:hypothetical protein